MRNHWTQLNTDLLLPIMSQRHNTASAASFSSHRTSATTSSRELQQYITDHNCDSVIQVHNTNTSELNINTTVMKQSIPISRDITRNNNRLNTPTYAQLLQNSGVNNRVATGAHHSNPNSTRVVPLLPRCASGFPKIVGVGWRTN